MSRTTTVTMGERGFWAFADAFGVWLAYLVEEIVRQGADTDPWLGSRAERWRVATAVTDYGADIGTPTPEQADRLRAIAVAARRTAQANGDVSVERLRRWTVLDDHPVAGGCSRTGDRVEVDRVLEVADGFIALLAGDLRPDPPAGAWFLGTGEPGRIIEHSEGARGDHPRFPRYGLDPTGGP